MQNSMWNQNHTQGMLNVLPLAVDANTSDKRAPPVQRWPLGNASSSGWVALGAEDSSDLFLQGFYQILNGT